MERKLELVWDGKAALGEGPAWDHRSAQIIWVDIMGKRVHFYDPAGGTHRSVTLDQRVGAAVPRAQGGLVLALENGFHTLDVESQRLTKLVDPERGMPGNRFNDGKCDGAGRFWAGTMNMEENQPTGSLYCLEPDGTLRAAVDGITTSNGLGWSLDGGTMYHIDSPTRRVTAYDYDLETGGMARPRTVVEIPQGEGLPDGMTVDEEGMLWIAQWDGWQVSRWDPATGAKIDSIPVPAARATSCTFGGADYDELYITTARIGQSDQQLEEQPHAGGLFRIKPGVKGRPTCFYGG